MPVNFSCFPGDSVTLDLAQSASIHHSPTQEQLLLLMCFGGHTSHFFHVMMPSDARQRKDPRTVVNGCSVSEWRSACFGYQSINQRERSTITSLTSGLKNISQYLAVDELGKLN